MNDTCVHHILAINPGSTSTKIAVFKGMKSLYQKDIHHSPEELESFEKITDQFEYRKAIIIKELKDNDIDMDCIRAVMGRGGLIHPVPSGVIAVNEKLKHDLRNSPIGEHASNLGGLIADDIASHLPHAKAYIADPVVVDEFEDIARIAGHPLFERKSIYHPLNQKAVAREYAHFKHTQYEELNLVVAHMGGGITVGAHQKGRVIDVNQGLDGEGPFTPQRSGNLPCGDLVGLCFSGKYTEAEIRKMINGQGGLMAYFKTNDARVVERSAQAGDPQAKLILEALAYQVAKEIGAYTAVLKGEVDAIILTGGLAYSDYIVDQISQRVKAFAPIHVVPGEDEMKALARNGLLVLNNETEVIVYQ